MHNRVLNPSGNGDDETNATLSLKALPIPIVLYFAPWVTQLLNFLVYMALGVCATARITPGQPLYRVIPQLYLLVGKMVFTPFYYFLVEIYYGFRCWWRGIEFVVDGQSVRVVQYAYLTSVQFRMRALHHSLPMLVTMGWAFVHRAELREEFLAYFMAVWGVAVITDMPAWVPPQLRVACTFVESVAIHLALGLPSTGAWLLPFAWLTRLEHQAIHDLSIRSSPAWHGAIQAWGILTAMTFWAPGLSATWAVTMHTCFYFLQEIWLREPAFMIYLLSTGIMDAILEEVLATIAWPTHFCTCIFELCLLDSPLQQRFNMLSHATYALLAHLLPGFGWLWVRLVLHVCHNVLWWIQAMPELSPLAKGALVQMNKGQLVPIEAYLDLHVPQRYWQLVLRRTEGTMTRAAVDELWRGIESARRAAAFKANVIAFAKERDKTRKVGRQAQRDRKHNQSRTTEAIETITITTLHASHYYLAVRGSRNIVELVTHVMHMMLVLVQRSFLHHIYTGQVDAVHAFARSVAVSQASFTEKVVQFCEDTSAMVGPVRQWADRVAMFTDPVLGDLWKVVEHALMLPALSYLRLPFSALQGLTAPGDLDLKGMTPLMGVLAHTMHLAKRLFLDGELWRLTSQGFSSRLRSQQKTMELLGRANELVLVDILNYPPVSGADSARTRASHMAEITSVLKDLASALLTPMGPMHPLLMQASRALSEKSEQIKAEHLSGGQRSAPFCISLFGAPAVGKSIITAILNKAFTAVLGLEDSEPYAIPANDRGFFFESYYPAIHHGVLVDDVAVPNPNKMDKNSFVGLLISMMNNPPFQCPIADIKRMGKVYFHSKYVVLTTNVENLNAWVTVATEAAVLRRLNWSIEVKLKDTFRGPLGGLAEGTVLDVSDPWTFTMKRYNMRHALFEEMHTFATVAALCQFLTGDFRRHMNAQEHILVVNRDRKFAGVCALCGGPLGGMSHETCTTPHSLIAVVGEALGEELIKRYVGWPVAAAMTIVELATVVPGAGSVWVRAFIALTRVWHMTSLSADTYVAGAAGHVAFNVLVTTAGQNYGLWYEVLTYLASSVTVWASWHVLCVAFGVVLVRTGMAERHVVRVVSRGVEQARETVVAKVVSYREVTRARVGFWLEALAVRWALPFAEAWCRLEYYCSLPLSWWRQRTMRMWLTAGGLLVATVTLVTLIEKWLRPPKLSVIAAVERRIEGLEPNIIDTHVICAPNPRYPTTTNVVPRNVPTLSSAQQSTMTLQAAVRNVANYIREIGVFDGDKFVGSSVAFFVRGNILMTTAHSVPGDGGLRVRVRVSGDTALQFAKDVEVPADYIMRNADADVALLYLPNIVGPSSWPLIWDKVADVAGCKGAVVHPDPSTKSFRVMFTDVILAKDPGPHEWQYDFTMPGASGAPVVVHHGGRVGIVAMHQAGSASLGACRHVDRALINDMIQRSCFPHAMLGQAYVPGLKPVSQRSVCRILVGEAQLLGTLDGVGRSVSTSRVVPTVVSGLIPSGFMPTEKVAPNMAWKQGEGVEFRDAYSRSVDVMVRPKPVLAPELVAGAFELYKSRVLAHSLPKGSFGPMTLDAATNGLPGVDFINGLAMNTAAGFGFPGKKTAWFYGDRPDAVPKEAVVAAIRARATQYNEGHSSGVIYVATLKDEPRKPEKVPRVFCACPVDFTLLVRMYFLPVLAFIHSFPEAFGIAIGINAASPAWGKIAEILAADEGARIVAGDFTDFDKLQGVQVMTFAFAFLIWVAATFGLYGERETEAMWCIASDVVTAMLCVKGDILSLAGQNPSGQPLTGVLNSIVNHLYLAMCALLVGRPDYYLRAWMMTYGDDLIAKMMHAEFNQVTLAVLMARLGQTFTDAQKSGDTRPFIPFAEATFLKRRFAKHASGIWLCPLELDSIGKMLRLWVPSVQLSPTQHAAAVLHDAVVECAFHSEALHAQMVEQAAIVSAALRVSVLVRTHAEVLALVAAGAVGTELL